MANGMRIGIYAAPSPASIGYVVDAERLGIDTVWVPEYWAYDALTPLAYAAARTERVRLATAIVQLGTRTPTMLAMSALTMQELSGGRFVLGVGTSGPQVMEGWHGVPFDAPLARTRETIEIVRAIAAGERLEHVGRHHRVPLRDGQRAMRSAAEPAHVPIHVAALGPRNLELTGAMADGWIGNSFFPETADVFLAPIRAAAHAAGRDPAEIEITVSVSVEFTDDAATVGRRHADGYAFTFGAMGSPGANFYNDAFSRQGWGDDVEAVAALWRAGRRDEAAARVPIEIGLGTNLIGDDAEIGRRLAAYHAAGVDSLRITPAGETASERLDTIARLLDLASGPESSRSTTPRITSDP